MNRLPEVEKEVQAGLETFIKGSSAEWDVEAYDQVSSTMDIAKQSPSRELSKPTIIIALKQNSGRGRLGRKWESPEGGLFLTFIFPSVAEVKALAGCSLVVGCALNKALSEIGCRARLKWPNDVLALSGKKLAGVLIELVNVGSSTAILCGIGLNIKNRPSGIENTTCLFDLGVEDLSLTKNTARIATHVKDYLTRFQNSGFAPFKSEWMRVAANVGQNIVVSSGEKKQSGMFIDVTSDGAMRIESNGKIETILSGDVESL